MTALVRIRPELITARRMRMEMVGLEDEDIENTVRMKGWAWVRSRNAWVYAGEPDFIYRQIREIIIALPDMAFDPDSIEESINSVREKARSDEEREEALALLRRAFEKTGQLDEAERFLGKAGEGTATDSVEQLPSEKRTKVRLEEDRDEDRSAASRRSAGAGG